MANRSPKPSAETINEAEKVAKATQRPGQTKEQTKLIAQGIQKGIELYKKQHKAKLREADKLKKKQQKQSVKAEVLSAEPEEELALRSYRWLPWLLLGLSWLGFISYLILLK